MTNRIQLQSTQEIHYRQFCQTYSHNLAKEINRILIGVLWELSQEPSGTSAGLAAFYLQQELYWNELPRPEVSFLQAAKACQPTITLSPDSLQLPMPILGKSLDLTEILCSQLVRHTLPTEYARMFHWILSHLFAVLGCLFSAMFGSLITPDEDGCHTYEEDPVTILDEANEIRKSLDDGFHEVHCALSRRLRRSFSPKFYTRVLAAYNDEEMIQQISQNLHGILFDFEPLRSAFAALTKPAAIA